MAEDSGPKARILKGLMETVWASVLDIRGDKVKLMTRAKDEWFPQLNLMDLTPSTKEKEKERKGFELRLPHCGDEAKTHLVCKMVWH